MPTARAAAARTESSRQHLSETARAARRNRLGRAIREARGETPQADLGNALGIPQTTISRWERGLVDLTVEQVLSLEVVMDLKFGALLMNAGYVDTKGKMPAVEAIRAELSSPEITSQAIEAFKGYQKLDRMVGGARKRR